MTKAVAKRRVLRCGGTVGSPIVRGNDVALDNIKDRMK